MVGCVLADYEVGRAIVVMVQIDMMNRRGNGQGLTKRALSDDPGQFAYISRPDVSTVLIRRI